MKFLIISNMAHYFRDGQLVGHGPTAREITYLAGLFDQVIHIGCLHDEPAPDLALPYGTDQIQFVPLPPSGGSGGGAKLAILGLVPLYIRTILKYLPDADVVHVRCPANIPLIAIILLSLFRYPQKRWIKYAGNWHPDDRDALSYRFQRWLLKRGWHQSAVTVNGHWDDDPAFVHNFINPCLTDAEWDEGQIAARDKQLTSPLRMLLIGRIERAKGVERALQVTAQLRARGIDARFDFVGDGPERPEMEQIAQTLGIREAVTFHGWLARTALAPLFEQSHLMVFPTNSSEGWPKVVSEAMAYGVVPLVGAVSSIPQFLGAFRVGKAIPPLDVDAFTAGVIAYIEHPAQWADESKRAVGSAARFRYTQFLEDVRGVLGLARGG